MRTHLIDNDIRLLLENEPDHFKKKIKTRLKNWQSAQSYRNIGFVEECLFYINQLQLRSQLSEPLIVDFWNNIFSKLDSLDFKFSSSHYFPNFDLGTTCNHNMVTCYIHLLSRLKERNIPFVIDYMKDFIVLQTEGISKHVSSVLIEFDPNVTALLSESEARVAVRTFIHEGYEAFLINNKSNHNQIETGLVLSVMSLANNVNSLLYGDEGYDNVNSLFSEYEAYENSQDQKSAIIKQYIEKYADTSKAFEFLHLFRPSSERIMNDCRIRYGRNFMDEYQKGVRRMSPLRKEWYSPKQIELIEFIEERFSLQFFKY